MTWEQTRKQLAGKFAVCIRTESCVQVPCSASESHSGMKQNLKKSSDADHRYGRIPVQNLSIMKLLPQIQAWVQLLSILTTFSEIYMCGMQRQPGKWEWLERYGMCLSEIAGLRSRINSRISWFCDSFYCCTFFIPLQLKQKGTK